MLLYFIIVITVISDHYLVLPKTKIISINLLVEIPVQAKTITSIFSIKGNDNNGSLAQVPLVMIITCE